MAVAASMLTAAYYILRDDVDYRDLGRDYSIVLTARKPRIVSSSGSGLSDSPSKSRPPHSGGFRHIHTPREGEGLYVL